MAFPMALRLVVSLGMLSLAAAAPPCAKRLAHISSRTQPAIIKVASIDEGAAGATAAPGGTVPAPQPAPPPNPVVAPPPQPAVSTADKAPVCSDKPGALANSNVTLQILPATPWQPVGGDIQFKLIFRQLGATPPSSIQVLFLWKSESAGHAKGCTASELVYRIPNLPADKDNIKVFTYAARVPDINNEGALPFLRIWGWYHWGWNLLPPPADMLVRGSWTDGGTPPATADFLCEAALRVTTPWMAAVLALGLLAIGFVTLNYWSKSRKIDGGPLLRIISTPAGVASLSQFQILLWTGVIGTGVTYVMLITGNLIDVPAQTLELLGVTGLTLVGSQLLTKTAGATPAANPPGPGIPRAVAVVGQPTQDSIVLTWSPPEGAPALPTYSVQMRTTNPRTDWTVAGAGIGVPPYPVSGLAGNTSFDFRVITSDPSGDGPASAPVTAQTAPPAGVAAAAAGITPPGPANPITASLAAEHSDVVLNWAAAAGPAAAEYVAQFRKAGSLIWTSFANRPNLPIQTSGEVLDYATDYEFQVFGRNGTLAGSPSNIVCIKTRARIPHWADLVMSSRARTEVDMGRVQMLVFTTIAAVFTALNILNLGEIPTIPEGELALIGLSNGVYLSAKYANKRMGDKSEK